MFANVSLTSIGQVGPLFSIAILMLGVLLLLASLRKEKRKQFWKDYYLHQTAGQTTEKVSLLERLSATLNRLFSSDKHLQQKKNASSGFL
ncbi:hypothetical protein HJ130_13170 [Vibrio parahaemolyticus]|nr:hypothetical protein [Vibrio parahaemolyticus]